MLGLDRMFETRSEAWQAVGLDVQGESVGHASRPRARLAVD